MRSLASIAVALVSLATFLWADSVRADAKSAPRIHNVVIENMQFSPRTLRIRAGDRVAFTNRDLFPHTATVKKNQPNRFDSGVINAGETWTVTPRAGEPIRYACTFHPTMEGEIVIER